MKQPIWTDDILKKRRGRAIIMAWLLAGFAALIIFVTIARIGGSIAQRPPISLSPISGEGR